jgi:hypothetical protein
VFRAYPSPARLSAERGSRQFGLVELEIEIARRGAGARSASSAPPSWSSSSRAGYRATQGAKLGAVAVHLVELVSVAGEDRDEDLDPPRACARTAADRHGREG